MVVDRSFNPARSDQCTIRSPRDLPRATIRSRAAGKAAIAVADGVATGEWSIDPTEATLFEALHTCAYRALGRGRRKPVAPSDRDQWEDRWRLIRDYIVEENLGLAYSIVGRFRGKNLDWDELRSEAFFALSRAVEGFNPWRGFKFSTYACNAITRALIYVANKTSRYRLRFPVEHDASFERPTRTDNGSDLYTDRLNRAMDLNLGELTDREAMVIEWRFPTDGGSGMTLGQVGEAIGLSKERVRQIQKRALDKLRTVLEADAVLQ